MVGFMSLICSANSVTLCRFSAHLGDDVLELALFPGISGVVHHSDDCIVILFILVVEEDKLSPQVCLFRSTEHLASNVDNKSTLIISKAPIKACLLLGRYLGDVDPGPEELQVFPHLLRFEL